MLASTTQPAVAEQITPEAPATQTVTKKKRDVLYAFIAIIIVVALCVAGFFTYKTLTKPAEVSMKLSVSLDDNWTDKSTPVILRLKSTNNKLTKFKAIRPSRGKSKTQTVTVKLPQGEYNVKYISPINADGSMYRAPKASNVTASATTPQSAKFEYIPSDKVISRDVKIVVNALKEARKYTEVGITNTDTMIADNATAVAQSNAELHNAIKQVKDNGKIAFTGIVKQFNTAEEAAAYIGGSPQNLPVEQILGLPYVLLILDEPTDYNHSVNSPNLYTDTASYIVLKTGPIYDSPVTYLAAKDQDWTQYLNKRIVLSIADGDDGDLLYSTNGGFFPFNPFYVGQQDVVYSQNVVNSQLNSIEIPSGTYLQKIYANSPYEHQPREVTIRGQNLTYKNNGDELNFTIKENLQGSTAQRQVYTLEADPNNPQNHYDLDHVIYYPESKQILLANYEEQYEAQ
ncbi:hypothetical protein [Alloscardovia sp. HMSC034E08]|uniref:hypothetical protein n=1 Tax=Alloscardovia sp. HMSC034E08 TaxID=1739413 RepID=UPI0008CEBB2C|nr:hypothetical protein [Alloscardovia sp. HMSC034E08]OFQ97843.1 hypothetical protein HMPREF2909_08500 [Alloscardovia sp. HMSC034E08]